MTPSIGTLQGVMSGGRALGEEAWQAGRQAQNLVWWNRGPGAASGLQGGWFYRPMNHPPQPAHPLIPTTSPGLTAQPFCTAAAPTASPSPFHRVLSADPLPVLLLLHQELFPACPEGSLLGLLRSPPSHQLTGGLPRLPHLEQRLAAPCFSYLTQFSLGALLTPWRCTSICLIIVCLSH